jgi:hypothetical protein
MVKVAVVRERGWGWDWGWGWGKGWDLGRERG